MEKGGYLQGSLTNILLKLSPSSFYEIPSCSSKLLILKIIM